MSGRAALDAPLRRVVAVAAAAVAFAVTFTLPLFVKVPLVWYVPREHRFALDDDKPFGIAIDWYGRNLWAALAAMLTFAIAHALITRLTPAPASSSGVASSNGPGAVRAAAVATAIALLVTIAAASIFAWKLAHRSL